MRTLARIIRDIFWLVVVAWIGRSIIRWLTGQRPGRVERLKSQPARRLRHDPWCGTYVADEIALRLDGAGEPVYFCSAECRDLYHRSAQRAAGA